MKISSTHKHVWISGLVYSVSRRQNDSRYWDCGQSWGPTPEKAAREEHINFHSGFKTVSDLEDFES